MVIMTMLCVPVAVAWLNTSAVLKLAGFDPDVSDQAGAFAKWFLLWLWPSNAFIMYSNHLQALHNTVPVLCVNVIMLGCNALLNYFFVFGVNGVGGIGFLGSPVATALTAWGSLLLIAGYAHVHGHYAFDWRHFHAEALSKARIRTFLGQALPTSAGNVIEDFQLTVMAFLAAKLSSVAVATHNAFLNLFLACSCLMYGAVKGTIIRIGFHLGARRVTQAQAVAALNLAVMTTIAGGVGSLIITMREHLGSIFSDDPEVTSLAAQIAVPVGCGYLAISVFFAAMAVLQGQGRPGAVTAAYLVGAWGVAVPLAFYLAPKRGLVGIWLALVAGYAIITVLGLVAVGCSNWAAAAAAAVARSAKLHVAGADAAAVECAVPALRDETEVDPERAGGGATVLETICDAVAGAACGELGGLATDCGPAQATHTGESFNLTC